MLLQVVQVYMLISTMQYKHSVHSTTTYKILGKQ